MVLPSYCAFSGSNVSVILSRCQFDSAPISPASGDRAPSLRRLRSAGSASSFIRASTGRCIVSRQPGSPSRTNPVRNDSRIFIECDMVSATSRPPAAAIRSETASCLSTCSRIIAVTARTFQLIGRSACVDIAVSSAISSSE
jgi:hypothetical protein